jgi:cell division septal protein FtsQ
MSVRAPAERRFRRAQVKPVRRKGGRTWLTWRAARTGAAILLVVFATYRAVDLVLTASTLQVTRIVVRGNVRISSGEVQALVEGIRGTSILSADLGAYRARLLESPWVADVGLRRVLPSTVEVFVSERRPMGICRLGATLYLIDETGTIIDEFGPQYAEFDLPIIDGLVRPPADGVTAIDERRAEFAARVLDALSARRDLAERVSQIDVSDVHDAVVLLESDPALLHLGHERFAERLQAYLDLAPALRERVPDIDYVDLRFDERLYVRPGSPMRRMAPTSAAAPNLRPAPSADPSGRARPRKARVHAN